MFGDLIAQGIAIGYTVKAIAEMIAGGGMALGGAVSSSTGIGAAVAVLGVAVTADGVLTVAAGSAIAAAAAANYGSNSDKFDDAVQEYQQKLECTEQDSSVEWTDYGHKHFPDKNKSWREIVKSTESGPAKYSPDIQNIEVFERDAWATGTPVTNGKNWKVKAYDHVIGATGGKETCFVRIECSGNMIHGHPISLQEYLKLIK